MPNSVNKNAGRITDFGVIAVENGFVTLDQVNECLDLQTELVQSGHNLKIGEIMLQQGYLLRHQLDSVLSAQKEARGERRIKGYEPIEKIGEGGMGTVIKARRTRDGRTVALKLLFKKLAEDDEYIQRFTREANISLTLDHPNLIKCLDTGEDQGIHFMALEFVEGEDLGKGLQRLGRYPEGQALAILLAAAKGMGHAHRMGLIHRDVKPANIMLTREGVVKVMDFGLARRVLERDHKLTLSGVLMGTPHYIAPEQVDGERDIDGRADMYSLGATFFHMLTGRPPFIGKNLYNILMRHATQRIPNPRALNKDLSEDVANLVGWMCMRERDKRLPSMERLVQEVRHIMGFDAVREEKIPVAFAEGDDPVEFDWASRQSEHYSRVRERLRCPRCSARSEQDPMLVVKDQRIRCQACGLVYPCPITPLDLVPEELRIDEEDLSDDAPLPAVSTPAPRPVQPTAPSESEVSSPAPVHSVPPSPPKAVASAPDPWAANRRADKLFNLSQSYLGTIVMLAVVLGLGGYGYSAYQKHQIELLQKERDRASKLKEEKRKQALARKYAAEQRRLEQEATLAQQRKAEELKRKRLAALQKAERLRMEELEFERRRQEEQRKLADAEQRRKNELARIEAEREEQKRQRLLKEDAKQGKPEASWVFVLKDQRKILAQNFIDAGKEISVLGLDGRYIVIKKTDILKQTRITTE